jgi:hypothetical protein
LLWANNLRRAGSSPCACATVLETVSAEQRTAVHWSFVSMTSSVANVPWPTVDVVEVDVVVLVIGRVLLPVVIVVGRDDRLLICIVLRLLLIALPRAAVVTLRHREHNTLETLVALRGVVRVMLERTLVEGTADRANLDRRYSSKRLGPFVARRVSTQELRASPEQECWQARWMPGDRGGAARPYLRGQVRATRVG